MTERPKRESSAKLLELAASHAKLELAGLVEAVPAMLAEAERRRRRAALPEARMFAAARVFLPRLALVTAALVVAALLLPSRTSSARPADASAIDRFVLGGSSEAGVPDSVLDTLLRGEQR